MGLQLLLSPKLCWLYIQTLCSEQQRFLAGLVFAKTIHAFNKPMVSRCSSRVIPQKEMHSNAKHFHFNLFYMHLHYVKGHSKTKWTRLGGYTSYKQQNFWPVENFEIISNTTSWDGVQLSNLQLVWIFSLANITKTRFLH